MDGKALSHRTTWYISLISIMCSILLKGSVLRILLPLSLMRRICHSTFGTCTFAAVVLIARHRTNGGSFLNFAEILGDIYSKKTPLPSMDHNMHCSTHVPPPGHYPVMHHLTHVSPLPSMGTSPCLAISPTDTSYQVLGQSRIQQRNTTRYNHPRIHAQ